MQTCYLVGASPDAVSIEPNADDFVIAVDAGAKYLREWGITPNMIVGDCYEPDYALPEDVLIIKTSREKRGTDMALAFAEGYHRGMRYFVFTGASGGHMNYTAANWQLLVRAAELGAFAMMHGTNECMTVLTDKGELRLCGRGRVSVFAYGGEATGVTIRGMRHSMERETLRGDTPRGVNNYLDGGEGFITMESGVLMIYWETSKIDLLEHFVNI